MATEAAWQQKLKRDFAQRFEGVPGNAYVTRFHKLLCESTRRFHAVRHGEDESLNPDVFGEDIRGQRESLLKQIRSQGELPAMPQLVKKLDAVLSDPDASVRDAAEVVAMDPSITARTIHFVNSSAFNLARKVERLDDAVALLGISGVRNIVLGASVLGTFGIEENELFSPQRFWQHSLAVASAAALIARTLTEKEDTGSVDVDLAFMAGLLHDVGKILIVHQRREQYREVCKLSAAKRISRMDAEMAVFGLQHTDFGHALLEQWELPECVCAAALSHHEPATTGTFVYVVHLADAIAHGLGFSPDLDRFPKLDPRVWAELDLSDRVIERIGFEVLAQVEEASSVLG